MDDVRFATGISRGIGNPTLAIVNVPTDSAANVSRQRRDYAAVVNAIVALAHNLNMCLVAEGVETADQVVMLQALGCDLAQGYYFAHPLEPHDATQYLQTRRMIKAA